MKFRTLNADEIEVRIQSVRQGAKQKGAILLLYKDARCDMNILDETLGAENWQRTHKEIKGNLYCTVMIRTEHGWIGKEDCGTESNTEAVKGEASDSFKRACVNVGIGRELYTAPFIWVGDDKCTITEINGKFQCNDKFYVESIEYDDKRRISGITIIGKKNNRQEYIAFAWEREK